jgi:hypothetical protein
MNPDNLHRSKRIELINAREPRKSWNLKTLDPKEGQAWGSRLKRGLTKTGYRTIRQPELLVFPM